MIVPSFFEDPLSAKIIHRQWSIKIPLIRDFQSPFAAVCKIESLTKCQSDDKTSPVCDTFLLVQQICDFDLTPQMPVFIGSNGFYCPTVVAAHRLLMSPLLIVPPV